jgi:hypothetical protein
MKYLHLALAMFLSFSCGSLQSKEGPWIEQTVKLEKMKWHRCSSILDPDKETWGNGWCFVSRECRLIDRPWPLPNKDECRQKQLFCADTDKACMDTNRFQDMELRF